MEETHTLRPSTKATTEERRPRGRGALKFLGISFLIVCGAVAGAGVAALGKFYGRNPIDVIAHLGGTVDTVNDPRSKFPGQDHLTVLCLGLDRNVYANKRDREHTGMFYSKGTRSDVMMVANLNLNDGTVSVLSIPRDTRVQLPGKRHFSKINQAHADGGIPYTKETVEQFLGVPTDHYVVIKQEAIAAIVNTLGGLNVDVEHDMDYDDNWGQLHIHLKKGPQTLDGTQVVGYMRFRHDAEGDLGRIRRQQKVIQLLAEKVKSPSVITKAGRLISDIKQYVETDFTPDQQLALAVLFHKLQPGAIQTMSMPVADIDTIDGVSYVIPDDYKKEAAVDWIIHGNRDAENRLIRVQVKNASGSRRLYQQVYDCLHHYGFEVVAGGRVEEDPSGKSHAVQHTNMRGAARRVLEVLGIPGGAVEKSEEKGTDVVLYVGKDLEQSQIVSSPDTWPDVPERPRGRRARVARGSLERATVRVRSTEADEEGGVRVETHEPASETPPSAQETPAPSPAPATDAPAEKKPDGDSPGQ